METIDIESLQNDLADLYSSLKGEFGENPSEREDSLLRQIDPNEEDSLFQRIDATGFGNLEFTTAIGEIDQTLREANFENNKNVDESGEVIDPQKAADIRNSLLDKCEGFIKTAIDTYDSKKIDASTMECEKDIRAARSELYEKANEIKQINKELGSKRDHTGLYGAVDSLEKEKASLQSDLKDLQYSTHFGDPDTLVEMRSIQGKIEDVDGKIKATSDKIMDLQTTKETVQSKISELKDRISSIEDKKAELKASAIEMENDNRYKESPAIFDLRTAFNESDKDPSKIKQVFFERSGEFAKVFGDDGVKRFDILMGVLNRGGDQSEAKNICSFVKEYEKRFSDKPEACSSLLTEAFDRYKLAFPEQFGFKGTTLSDTISTKDFSKEDRIVFNSLGRAVDAIMDGYKDKYGFKEGRVKAESFRDSVIETFSHEKDPEKIKEEITSKIETACKELGITDIGNPDVSKDSQSEDNVDKNEKSTDRHEKSPELKAYDEKAKEWDAKAEKTSMWRSDIVFNFDKMASAYNRFKGSETEGEKSKYLGQLFNSVSRFLHSNLLETAIINLIKVIVLAIDKGVEKPEKVEKGQEDNAAKDHVDNDEKQNDIESHDDVKEYTVDRYDENGNLIATDHYVDDKMEYTEKFDPKDGTHEVDRYNQDGKVETTEYYDNDNVKIATDEYKYDENGKVDSIEHYDEKDELESIERYHYDENDNVESVEHFDKDNNLESVDKYQYNENGKIDTVEHRDAEGNLDSIEHRSKDDDQKIESVDYYDKDDKKDRTEHYDEAGKLTSVDHYDENGNVESVEKYTYDDKGTLTDVQSYDEKGSPISRDKESDQVADVVSGTKSDDKPDPNETFKDYISNDSTVDKNDIREQYKDENGGFDKDGFARDFDSFLNEVGVENLTDEQAQMLGDLKNEFVPNDYTSNSVEALTDRLEGIPKDFTDLPEDPSITIDLNGTPIDIDEASYERLQDIDIGQTVEVDLTFIDKDGQQQEFKADITRDGDDQFRLDTSTNDFDPSEIPDGTNVELNFGGGSEIEEAVETVASLL